MMLCTDKEVEMELIFFKLILQKSMVRIFGYKIETMVEMPFGLKNAPAQFQRFMTQALSKYIGKICMVYLDDIIVIP